jgi:hypothetical protein
MRHFVSIALIVGLIVAYCSSAADAESKDPTLVEDTSADTDQPEIAAGASIRYTNDDKRTGGSRSLCDWIWQDA